MHTKNSRFLRAWRLRSTQHAAINPYQNVCPHFVIKASSMVSKQIGLQLKTKKSMLLQVLKSRNMSGTTCINKRSLDQAKHFRWRNLLLPNKITVFIAERIHNSTINWGMRSLSATSSSRLTRLTRGRIRRRQLRHLCSDSTPKNS